MRGKPGTLGRLRLRDALRLWGAGASAREIAKVAGVTPSAVWLAFKGRVRKRKSPGGVGRLTVRQAADLYHLRGWTLEKIAEKAGVRRSSVSTAFRRHGIPTRHRKILREDFQMARDLGWSKARLAKHVGVSRSGLRKAQARLSFSWPERDGYRGPASPR